MIGTFLLIAILLPSHSAARSLSRRTACQSNLRQLAITWHSYFNDYDGKFIKGLNQNANYGGRQGLGEVAFGAIGQGNRLEMTVIGAPVNVSAKLEKHNKVLGSVCIIAKKTWDAAVAQGYAGRLRPAFLEASIDGIRDAQHIAVIGMVDMTTAADPVLQGQKQEKTE